MYDRIPIALEEIEAEHDCRILYACESGSRAWGFPSPDSDFDVRFLYVHPVDWYLHVDDPPDTIERMDSKVLDFSGWELGKALRLLAGCNPSLKEWLRSPWIYREQTNLRLELLDIAAHSFNSKKAFHHYLNLARKTAERHLSGDEVGIKKLFYILRSVHCCHWIARFHSMPPTHFPNLLEAAFGGSALADWTREAIEIKRTQDERSPIRLPGEIRNWLVDQLKALPARADDLPTGRKASAGKLNAILADKVRNPDRELHIDLRGPGPQMDVREAYDILCEQPWIDDFDERVERLVEISEIDVDTCLDYLETRAKEAT